MKLYSYDADVFYRHIYDGPEEERYVSTYVELSAEQESYVRRVWAEFKQMQKFLRDLDLQWEDD